MSRNPQSDSSSQKRARSRRRAASAAPETPPPAAPPELEITTPPAPEITGDSGQESLAPPAPPETQTADCAAPGARLPAWTRRQEILWNRVEALLEAWLGAFWAAPGEDACPTSAGFARPGAAASPPAEEMAPSLREPPPPRDLSVAIICLRRLQDSRLALARECAALDSTGGGPVHESSGNGVDPAALQRAVSRLLLESARPRR